MTYEKDEGVEDEKRNAENRRIIEELKIERERYIRGEDIYKTKNIREWYSWNR